MSTTIEPAEAAAEPTTGYSTKHTPATLKALYDGIMILTMTIVIGMALVSTVAALGFDPFNLI